MGESEGMFGIGFWEFVLIAVVVLLVLGPEKIGPMMRTLGRAMREVQRGVQDIRQALRIDDEIEKIDDISRRIVSDVRELKEDEKEDPARWDELHSAGDAEGASGPEEGKKSG